MANKRLRELMDDLEDKIKGYGKLAPDIHDLIGEMKIELAQANDNQDEVLAGAEEPGFQMRLEKKLNVEETGR